MAAAEVPEKVPSAESSSRPPSDELINASGHRQELERNFSLLSICGVAVTTGNTWIAQGGSVVCFSNQEDTII
jgi:choline transport protein